MATKVPDIRVGLGPSLQLKQTQIDTLTDQNASLSQELQKVTQRLQEMELRCNIYADQLLESMQQVASLTSFQNENRALMQN